MAALPLAASLASGPVAAVEDLPPAGRVPNDFAGHGTAVASVVAARTDTRVGVAVTAWHATTPQGDVVAFARAFDYATVDGGASVVNRSFTAPRVSRLPGTGTGAGWRPAPVGWTAIEVGSG